jgi:hypothetical protein
MTPIGSRHFSTEHRSGSLNSWPTFLGPVAKSGHDEGHVTQEWGEYFMPYDDIDWETACNDFHPAFALVRGERYEPDAKPNRRSRDDRGLARAPVESGLRRVRLKPIELRLVELVR